ncbi:MAG: hypothetical protein AABW79_03570 [Nanoarchaeota archaeon]
MAEIRFNDKEEQEICNYVSGSSYEETRSKLDEALKTRRITSARHLAYVKTLNNASNRTEKDDDSAVDLMVDAMMDGQAGNKLLDAMNRKPKDAEYHAEKRVLDIKEKYASLERAIKRLNAQREIIKQTQENIRKAA